MKKALILGLALCGAFVFAGTASAQTYVVPCFEWVCSSSNSGDCDFDAGNCSTGGGAWFWSWDFGDGNIDPFNTGPTTSHNYPGGHTSSVTLTISFFGKPDEDTTCSVQYRNVIGPPQPLTGDCALSTGCNC